MNIGKRVFNIESKLRSTVVGYDIFTAEYTLRDDLGIETRITMYVFETAYDFLEDGVSKEEKSSRTSYFLKRFALIVFLLILAYSIFGQGCDEVPWGTNMSDHRFNNDSYQENASAKTIGSVKIIDGNKVYVTHKFNRNLQLNKVHMSFHTLIGRKNEKENHKAIKNGLEKKYGTPKFKGRPGSSPLLIYETDSTRITYHYGKEGWSRVHYIEYEPIIKLGPSLNEEYLEIL